MLELDWHTFILKHKACTCDADCAYRRRSKIIIYIPLRHSTLPLSHSTLPTRLLQLAEMYPCFDSSVTYGLAVTGLTTTGTLPVSLSTPGAISEPDVRQVSACACACGQSQLLLRVFVLHTLYIKNGCMHVVVTTVYCCIKWCSFAERTAEYSHVYCCVYCRLYSLGGKPNILMYIYVCVVAYIRRAESRPR